LSACIRMRGKGRRVSEEIRTFGTTSDELLVLHDWLKEHGVTAVAMEATGVYWKPVYYLLEDAFRVTLVNPTEIKRIPVRKANVSDCA
jgi:transposase